MEFDRVGVEFEDNVCTEGQLGAGQWLIWRRNASFADSKFDMKKLKFIFTLKSG